MLLTEYGDTVHFRNSFKESFVWSEGYVCNKISSLSDSLRSTIDFQSGGAASVGEYKKIISVSSNELIMQIGQRKEIQS